MSLFNESTPFGCAISGAPVADWNFYDSAYTERYLGSLLVNKNNIYPFCNQLFLMSIHELKFLII